VYIVKAKTGKRVFVTGHSEYDPRTLQEEYERDLEKGLILMFQKTTSPMMIQLYPPGCGGRVMQIFCSQNWLNYYVYQATPYNIEEIH
jgi:homoserine O-succinyltransferase